MAKYKICRIPGDGIGKDVMDAAMIVADAVGLDVEWVDAEAGWGAWEKYHDTVPKDTWEKLESTDACLFGAITSKPGIKGFKSAILQIRQKFDLYVNLRPVKSFKGVPLNYRDDIDLAIFRENTEGLYSSVEFRPIPEELLKYPGMEKYKNSRDNALSFRPFTREGCERIIRAAYEYAKEYNRRSVTLVEKPNVIRKTGGLFIEVGREIAQQYPEIETKEANVDAMAMWLIKNPQDYDVIVTTNMFGDIISDEAAQLVGGMGFAASGNIGEKYALFEPTHGSAPKYAGQYKVNPTAMILAFKMMLQWLGEKEKADRLERAIEKVLAEGKVKTYDLGGSNTTLEMAEAYAKAFSEV